MVSLILVLVPPAASKMNFSLCFVTWLFIYTFLLVIGVIIVNGPRPIQLLGQ